MNAPATHLGIDHALCGEPVELEEGRATTRFVTTAAMGTDEHGLVHGGFVFGLADHAAMLAVNHPFVVLGKADLRFTAPVRVGETVRATAQRTEIEGKKHVLDVKADVDGRLVLEGVLTAFVLDQHVLEAKS